MLVGDSSEPCKLTKDPARPNAHSACNSAGLELQW